MYSLGRRLLNKDDQNMLDSSGLNHIRLKMENQETNCVLSVGHASRNLTGLNLAPSVGGRPVPLCYNLVRDLLPVSEDYRCKLEVMTSEADYS